MPLYQHEQPVSAISCMMASGCQRCLGFRSLEARPRATFDQRLVTRELGLPLEWEGVVTIAAKRENPKWYPTEDIQWKMGVPPVVYPGPQNPLGPRTLYLGDTLYRIHGTHRPGSIGGAVSHGCFRMHNAHIIKLYDEVQIGANVHVVP